MGKISESKILEDVMNNALKEPIKEFLMKVFPKAI